MLRTLRRRLTEVSSQVGPESQGAETLSQMGKMKSSFLPTALGLVTALTAGTLSLACGGAINQPKATGSVTKTANPLVAQYAVSSGCIGEAVVEFGPDTSYGRSTSSVPVVGGYKTSYILVAGMRASTTYHMRADVTCLDTGQPISTPDTTFTTGPLPSIPFPHMTVSRPNPSKSSPENPGIELVNIIQLTSTDSMQAYFIDRDANPIWYYDVGANKYPFTMKLLPNGHMILSIFGPDFSTLREVDLTGNIVREMPIDDLANKTNAAGYSFRPTDYHHDICILPNGHLIVLVQNVKDFTDLPGYPGTTSVGGDALIELDENWNPVWAWNTFDHLDVNRHLYGLPDWTHSNAVVYDSKDGNLLLSMRHQSWIIKIDYANGTGSGNILWHLGYQGDFALTQKGIPTDDPSLWFSFQHFPSIVSQKDTQTTLAVWDNGDYRVMDTSGDVCVLDCYSRAVLFQYDESSKVANIVWQHLPGLYSLWGGSINQLANENVEFDLNAPFPNTAFASEVEEVTQTSSPQTVWKMDISRVNAYRAYRVPSLYPGVTWQK